MGLDHRHIVDEFSRLYFSYFACTLFLLLASTACALSPTSHAGHLQPFGSLGPFHDINNVDSFPRTVEFFENYVLPQKPLKMTGAGKLSAAFSRWTDDYFLSTAVAPDSKIIVETAKKELRTNPTKSMHFHDFVRMYNTTDEYMVNHVPNEFRQDVLLPGPLQCQQLYKEMLVEMVMWMSSGGTSSVVHTDAVENIICVYHGMKRFVMVDPTKYKSKVTIDHPEGAYSGIDVDRVDFSEYPGLAEVEYHVVDVSAGDCLYIPYKWIHQVRSYGRNLAVNIWWNHHQNEQLDLELCTDDLDLNLTIDKVTFHGFETLNDDVESLREHFEDIIQNGVDVNRFIDLFIGNNEYVSSLHLANGYRLPLIQIFLILDKDRDKTATVEELHELSDRDWSTIQRQISRFEMIMDSSQQKSSPVSNLDAAPDDRKEL